MSHLARTLTALLILALASGAALAHQSKEVGDGAYRVIVGYLVNPAYSGQVNGIDLAIRNADNEPMLGLERSIVAWVIAPDGTELQLTLRPNAAKEGWYTGDFIPTVSGNYTFRVSGFIGTTEFNELFDQPAHNDPAVLDAATISVP
ncbi:MAG: hypothetical protein WDA03_13305 [Trueperaceae bacterium]